MPITKDKLMQCPNERPKPSTYTMHMQLCQMKNNKKGNQFFITPN